MFQKYLQFKYTDKKNSSLRILLKEFKHLKDVKKWGNFFQDVQICFEIIFHPSIFSIPLKISFTRKKIETFKNICTMFNFDLLLLNAASRT